MEPGWNGDEAMKVATSTSKGCESLGKKLSKEVSSDEQYNVFLLYSSCYITLGLICTLWLFNVDVFYKKRFAVSGLLVFNWIEIVRL